MDFFFFDSETHIWGPMDDIAYYPPFQRYVASMVGIGRHLGFHKGVADRGSGQVQADAAALIDSMDEGGVQMACVLPEIMLDLSYGHRVRSTNGFVAKQIAKYPKRLAGVANVGPIVQRGVKNAIWELEYLVKEHDFKACKLYPPDEVPIDDRALWPFYEAVQNLGIPLFVHTGFSWVAPGKSANCMPMLLDDVCVDFPEMPIVAYHLGYPRQDDLNMLAAKFPNLYIQTSLLPRISPGPTKKAQMLLAEAISWGTTDKIIWGTDWSGSMLRHKTEVEFLKTIQISEDLQQDYGYKPLTDEDRNKWAGLNLARIMNINPNG